MKIYTDNDETLIIDLTASQQHLAKRSKRLKMRQTQVDQYIESITLNVFSEGKYERCADEAFLSEEVPSTTIPK